nr:MAG TPA: hypothetical protein [Caudoviricetes sp.]
MFLIIVSIYISLFNQGICSKNGRADDLFINQDHRLSVLSISNFSIVYNIVTIYFHVLHNSVHRHCCIWTLNVYRIDQSYRVLSASTIIKSYGFGR